MDAPEMSRMPPAGTPELSSLANICGSAPSFATCRPSLDVEKSVALIAEAVEKAAASVAI